MKAFFMPNVVVLGNVQTMEEDGILLVGNLAAAQGGVYAYNVFWQ